ncbi:MAG TPA: sulfotransferase [Pyrinomonadaceae bacterium]|jgi:hypothetical protein
MAQHLIHIGYPKTGSTFLQAWFERHPEFRYAPGGLSGFHNVYEVARPDETPYKFYVTSFEGLSTPHAYAGEVRLDFGGARAPRDERVKDNQRAVCSLLASLYPHSRVLVMTRGFRAMILSAYSQSVRMGARLHLAEMCRELADRLRDDARHYYDYDYLIKLYVEAFGAENVLVLPYELLRDDQAKFLAALEARLGVSHAEVELGRVNPSLSPEELYWYPVISRAVSAAAARLGPARRERLYGWYVRRTLDNRLRRLVAVLARLRPDRRITGADFPKEILSLCVGKATRLKGDPLYAPYSADYLWDEPARG